MQKIGAQYVVKKIADQILAPPAQSAAEAEPAERGERAERAVVTDSNQQRDKQIIHDEEGELVGTAYRLRDVAVYVVCDGYRDPRDEFERSLEETETRLLFQTQGGRTSALIYVPDPSRAPVRIEGTRPDDV